MSRILSLLVALILIIAAFMIYRAATGPYVENPQDTGTPQANVEPTQSVSSTSAAPSSPQFEKWREFTSGDAQFRVLLPSLPQHVKDKFNDPVTKEPRKYDAFVTTESGQPVFMISAITLPKELEKGDETEKTLKATVDQIVSKNPDNKLQSTSMGEFRSIPAIDFSIANGNAKIGGKAFAYKNTLYILTMGNDKNSFNQSEMDFFVNSFQVVNKKTDAEK